VVPVVQAEHPAQAELLLLVVPVQAAKQVLTAAEAQVQIMEVEMMVLAVLYELFTHILLMEQ
jgi:hypothetical protein